MPYRVSKGGGTCGKTQFAVVNKATGKTMGCHSTKASATKQLAALNINVVAHEAAEGPSMPTPVRETAAITAEAAATAAQSGRMLIQLIDPGWGTSGYYSPTVLESAATDRVFPAGTQMFLDHPTESEETERPERSVRDLAAVLTSDATWTATALVGEATVFAPYRDVLAEMKDAIGVSIRAAAMVTEGGEADGRRGRIIDQLVEGTSVDFVTRAGRGGRVLEVLESARAAMVAATESTNPIVPTTRSDSTTKTTKESQEDTMPKIEIDEAEHKRLVEQADRVAALEAERDTEKSRAETAEKALAEAKKPPTPRGPREIMEARDNDLRNQVAQLTAREAARSIIGDELAQAWLPPTTVARLSTELLESLPIVEDKLDESTLRTRCVERRDQAELEAAEALNAAGVGAPRGLGGYSSNGGGAQADSTKLGEQLAENFQALGLSESAAKTAVKGR